MKTARILLSFAVAMAAVCASAATVTINGIKWTYVVNGKYATIGNAYKTAIPQSTKGAVTVPSTIKAGTKTYTVNIVARDAFNNCTNLTKVTFPSTVKTLGMFVCEGCTKLKSVVLPSGLKAIPPWGFAGCGNLTTINLPSSLTSIDTYAFWGCGFESVIVPPSVTQIRNQAFAACDNLVAAILPDGAYIPSDAFGAVPCSKLYWSDIIQLDGSAKGSVTWKVDSSGAITVTAKPASGSVLAYWWTGVGDYKDSFSATRTFSSATSFAAGLYRPVFRAKSELIKPYIVSGKPFWLGANIDDPYTNHGTNLWNGIVGVRSIDQLNIPDACWPIKITAKGLPPGLKVNASNGKITGVPTKAGVFTASVTMTSTANKKLTRTQKVKFCISKMPAWMSGTFVGYVKCHDDATGTYNYGYSTLTVSSAGKISGKVSFQGQTWTYATTGYYNYAGADILAAAAGYSSEFPAKLTRTVGKKTYTRNVTVSVMKRLYNSSDSIQMSRATFSSPDFGDVTMTRHILGYKSAQTAYSPYPGKYTYYSIDGEKLSLSIAPDGAAKLAGKLHDGRKLSVSTRAVVDLDTEDRKLIVYPYAPPYEVRTAHSVTAYSPYFAAIRPMPYALPAYSSYYEPPPAVTPPVSMAYRNPGLVASIHPYSSAAGTFSYSPAYGQASSGTIKATATPNADSVFAYWLRGSDTTPYSFNPTLSVAADPDCDIDEFRAVFRAKSDYAYVTADEVYYGFVDNPDEWACTFAGGTATVTGLKAKKKVKPYTFVTLDGYAYRPVTFTFKNLPKGLSVNKYTGVLSGTPAQKGTYTATLTVTLTAKPSVKHTAKVKFVIK